MQNVSDKTIKTLELSAALSNVIRHHNDSTVISGKYYMLSWFQSDIYSGDGRGEIIDRIINRFQERINLQRQQFNRKDDLSAVEKFRVGANQFIEDFKKLSHTDIDILKDLTPVESGTRPLPSIGNNKFILKEVS